MPTITMQFPSPVNASVEVGDTIYFSDPASVGGFDVGNSTNEVGTIVSIDDQAGITYIVCNYDESSNIPTDSSFIFFSKNKEIHQGSLKGYYANFKFVNNSTKKAELYSSSCEVTESSK
jgi:hypothetical protein